MGELLSKKIFVGAEGGVFIYMDNTTNNTVNQPIGTAISFGSNSNNTVINNNNSGNNEFEEITKLLLDEIKKSELGSEKQEELSELVDAVNSELTAERPKKAILKSCLDSANSIIQLGANSTNLITAFEKWSTYISQVLGG